MKRDKVSIKLRIKKMGLTNEHVAKMCKIHPSTLASIVSGKEGYGSKDTIERIHAYLDTVKTDGKP
jgi:transcriptional regulator with XRE-family HTH domain